MSKLEQRLGVAQMKNHKKAVARVKAMQHELMSSDSLHKNICLNLGIREDSGARLFKRRTGLTMTQWRAKRRLK